MNATMPSVALALLALAPLQDGPTLLPETPPNWLFERLEFPLSFAPELEFEGFEELAFAPGMFDPESDSYFSYALAILLHEELEVDAAFVESFLVAYYRGLCQAVAEGRFELDREAVAVRVEGDRRRFSATVDMFDAFVTGEPLTLRFELSVRQRARGTELFGLASPKPEGAGIWGELRALRDLWQASGPTPVFLNHLYLVADEETYSAMLASEFLREDFGVFEERETVRADTSYTGQYFYGERTYFEFLKPSTSFAAGGTGLAFGIEEEGGTVSVSKELERSGIQTFVGPISRGLDGRQVPWFRIMGVERAHASSQLDLFSLEYDPRFLDGWHVELPPHDGSISRAGVLRRYAALLGGDVGNAAPLFEDVTEVRLALDPAERTRFLEVCHSFGYVLEEAAAGSTISYGPGFRMRLAESPEPGGVTGFSVSLRRPFEHEEMTFGRVTLSFEGRTADFSFDP